MSADILELAEQAEDAGAMLAALSAGMASGDVGEWSTEALEGAYIIMQRAQDAIAALVDGVRREARA